MKKIGKQRKNKWKRIRWIKHNTKMMDKRSRKDRENKLDMKEINMREIEIKHGTEMQIK